MNPFSWSGPEFLVFYAALAVVVLGLCGLRMLRQPAAASVRFSPADLSKEPYRIAYLRGGRDEAIRVAAFNLVDRGWLTFDGERLRAARGGADDALRRPLDRAIVGACTKPRAPRALASCGAVKGAADAYEGELAQRGLMLPRAESAARRWIGRAAIALLLGIALAKCAYATARGYDNVGFLVMLAIVAAIAASVICRPRLPAAGKEALDTMRALVGRLGQNASRLERGGATNEALLLAAVLGLYALPGETYAFVEDMYPKPKPSSGDASSGDGGGGSCSSSCGGGGGCGGCGGG